MAEGELAVVAGEEIQAHQRDGVDADLGELEEPEAAHVERQREGDVPTTSHREDDARAASHRSDRRAAVRPKSPLGLTSSTTMIMARATVSLSSVPMKDT